MNLTSTSERTLNTVVQRDLASLLSSYVFLSTIRLKQVDQRYGRLERVMHTILTSRILHHIREQVESNMARPAAFSLTSSLQVQVHVRTDMVSHVGDGLSS